MIVWEVEGIHVKRIKHAKFLCDAAIRLWDGMSEEDRKASVEKGGRKPAEWDEAAYLAKCKPSRIGNRSYPSLDMAEQVKTVAEAIGWRYVTIRKRETA